MQPKFKLGLSEIFDLQDDSLERHLAESDLLRRAFYFLSDATSFILDILQTMRFPAEKQTAIRVLAVGCLSPTIVATRLTLWGALPESLSVLRGGLESCAQLQFVVQQQKYMTAVYEMQNNFDQISYENAIASLGELGSKIDKSHGRMSEYAAHSTARRCTLTDYELGGRNYDRVGFALDLEGTQPPIYHCILLCKLTIDALYRAHEQDDAQFDRKANMLDLLMRGEELCTQFVSSAKQEQ